MLQQTKLSVPSWENEEESVCWEAQEHLPPRLVPQFCLASLTWADHQACTDELRQEDGPLPYKSGRQLKELHTQVCTQGCVTTLAVSSTLNTLPSSPFLNVTSSKSPSLPTLASCSTSVGFIFFKELSTIWELGFIDVCPHQTLSASTLNGRWNEIPLNAP